MAMAFACRKQNKFSFCQTQCYVEMFSLLYFLPFFLAVIQALVALVHDPEPEHPLRGELAEEYTKDKKKFMRNAEEHTKKHAEKRP